LGGEVEGERMSDWEGEEGIRDEEGRLWSWSGRGGDEGRLRLVLLLELKDEAKGSVR
jgi:hypothetical protein